MHSCRLRHKLQEVNDYPIQSPGQLSSHLRALRKVRGLSQAQLGALLGVGQTRVARIERDLHPGAIVLLHEGAAHGHNREILRRVLQRLDALGYATVLPEALEGFIAGEGSTLIAADA